MRSMSSLTAWRTWSSRRRRWESSNHEGGCDMRLEIGTTIRFSLMAGAAFMAGAVQLFTADSAIAQQIPACAPSDFVTGGGFIVFTNGDHGNFGVAGGCKNGSFFGHLEYVDHGSEIAPPSAPTPFNVHWTSITAYRSGTIATTTREICGTARTNDPAHPTVQF